MSLSVGGFRDGATIRKFLGSQEHLDWLKIDLNAAEIITVQDYKRIKKRLIIMLHPSFRVNLHCIVCLNVRELLGWPYLKFNWQQQDSNPQPFSQIGVSVHLQTKWLWIWIVLLPLKHQKIMWIEVHIYSVKVRVWVKVWVEQVTYKSKVKWQAKRPKLKENQLGIFKIYAFCREIQQWALGPGESATGVLNLWQYNWDVGASPP